MRWNLFDLTANGKLGFSLKDHSVLLWIQSNVSLINKQNNLSLFKMIWRFGLKQARGIYIYIYKLQFLSYQIKYINADVTLNIIMRTETMVYFQMIDLKISRIF